MSLSLIDIAGKFLPEHTIESIEPLGNGLINDSFLVIGSKNNSLKKVVLQKINSDVYTTPEIIIQNHIELFSELYRHQNAEKIISTLQKSIDGKFFFQHKDEYWRAQSYIDDNCCYDEVSDENIAFEGAKIVGKFNAAFTSLENILLRDPIKGFHNLKYYVADFEKALKYASKSKIECCISEIEFIKNWQPNLLNIFERSQKLPNRICHYDTKINNILFDKKSNKSFQIIDLDNVMYGKVIFDFGDMMRTFISPVDENEQDLGLIKIRWEIVEAISKGYLKEVDSVLNADEKSMLISGGVLITYEQVVRFLTDYLNDDKYYKIKYADHNLDRAKNQICLVKLFEENKERLESYMAKSIG